MKKQYVWVGGVVFLCFFAAAVWGVTHPSFVIPQLQDYVLRKTGRTLLVHGGARLTFLPKMSVRLDDVSISNPSPMDGSFARAEHADLPMEFADLFRRKIKIREINLNNARFSFLTDTQGTANWATADKAESGSSEAAAAKPKEPLVLNIENGAAFYLDERNGQAFSLNSATVSVSIGADGDVAVTGTAAINSQFASIDAHLKSLPRVTQDGSPADIAITAPALTLNFDGRLGTKKTLTLVGTLAAASSDLRVLSKWLGNEIGGTSGLKDLRLSGALESSGVDFKLSKVQLELDGMAANGHLALDLSKKVPRVEAKLSTDLLNLDPYLAKPGAAAPIAGEWKTSPVDASGLKGVDGSFSLSTFLVKWNGAEWGPVDLTASIKDNVLVAGFQNGTLYGGKGTAEVTLNGSTEVPSLHVDFDGHDLVGQEFFAGVLGAKWLAGITSLKASLSASGHNQQEMMSSLKGSFTIAVRDGKFIGLDIMERLARLGSAVVSGWGDDPGVLTTFSSATASFQVSDGVATSTDVNLQAPLAAVGGSGNVDMLRRALDFKFEPKLITGDGETQDLPVKVAVKGPWDSPKISPDVALEDLGLPNVTGKDVKKIEKKGKKLLKKLFGN